MQFEQARPFIGIAVVWALITVALKILTKRETWESNQPVVDVIWFLMLQFMIGPLFVIKLQNSARVLRALPMTARATTSRLLAACLLPAAVLGLAGIWLFVQSDFEIGNCLRFLLAGLGLFGLVPWLTFRHGGATTPASAAFVFVLGAAGLLVAWEASLGTAVVACLGAIASGWVLAANALRDGPEAYASRAPMAGLEKSGPDGESVDSWTGSH